MNKAHSCTKEIAERFKKVKSSRVKERPFTYIIRKIIIEISEELGYSKEEVEDVVFKMFQLTSTTIQGMKLSTVEKGGKWPSIRWYAIATFQPSYFRIKKLIKRLEKKDVSFE